MGETKTNLRLMLADDHPFVREGLRSFLADTPGMEIVAEAATGTEAVEIAETTKPDILLLDINMPGLNGIEAIRILRKKAPSIKILVLTVHNTREYVLQVAKAGAHGYLLKDAPPEDLLAAIKHIETGKRYFAPGVAGHLAELMEPPVLTQRESEVLILIAKGRTIKEMAEDLQITHSTVQTYRVRIMEKLGIHNVAGLTRWALKNGLLPLE